MDRWIKVTFFQDREKLLEYISEKGYSIVVIDTFGKARSFTDIKFPEKPLFAFGNEKNGVSQFLMDYDQFYIPQIGTQVSINVSNAASIVMYHIFKERWKNFERIDDWNCSYSNQTGKVIDHFNI